MNDEVLKGKLSEKDALEIKTVLQTEKENGNHFAAIPLTKDRLTKEDLAFFPSAMEAWKTLDQHTGRTNEFLYRSITLLQDEVDKQLDGKKGNEQDLRSAFAQALSDRMGRADWHWESSDDFRTWNKGMQETQGIQEDLRLLARLDGGLEDAKKLWAQHVPAYSVAPPFFFQSRSNYTAS